MTAPTQAVILCGGRGERLRPLTDHLPKPLAPVLGRPFVEYLVEQMGEAGLRRILLLTGYLGDMISDRMGDGSRFNVEIQYMQGPAEWETGRRIAEAAAMLDERFVLLYADNLAPFRLERLWERHVERGGAVTVTLCRKEKGNIRLDAAGNIEVYDSGRTAERLSHVEIGYMIAEKAPVLAMNPGRGSFSLVLEELARSGRLGALDPGCSYNSIADLKRLRKTEDFLRPRRLILLDRDGVLNRKAPRGEYVARKEDFVWIEENVAGLEKLGGAGFEFIVLSNQAGIGRGMVSAQAMDDLHGWMISELGQRGVRVRDLLMCPHHWEDHCACRKPLPGLFFQASTRHGFCLERSLYIGDDPRDVLAAWNASCPCLLVSGMEAEASKYELPAHRRASTVDEAVPWIVERYKRWESLAEASI